MIDIAKLNFSKLDGLIPAIIQDEITLEVLMLGFMNEEAVEQTIKTKLVTFYSRTKQKIWVKGETSGNYLDLISVHEDCDSDSLLILAKPRGPACHTGSVTCFNDQPILAFAEIAKVYQLISHHLDKDFGRENSYTKSLMQSGVKRIAQKVGEEAVEVAIAAIAESDKELVDEMRDLLYHMMVLLVSKNLTIKDLAGSINKKRLEKKNY